MPDGCICGWEARVVVPLALIGAAGVAVAVLAGLLAAYHAFRQWRLRTRPWPKGRVFKEMAD